MRILFVAVVLSLLSLVPVVAQQTPDGGAILEKVDAYRLPKEGLRYEVTIRTFSAGKQTEIDTYRIASSGSSSLIHMESPRSRGQVVLALGRQMWIKMPRSRQVIRITPLQRLTGNASFSDLGRLRFSDSYAVVSMARRSAGGEAAVVLHLKAHTSDVTFPTVALTVDASRYYPLKAVFYLPSGLRFKTLTFASPKNVKGRMISTTYTVTNNGYGGSGVSQVVVSHIERADLPASLFSLSRLEGD